MFFTNRPDQKGQGFLTFKKKISLEKDIFLIENFWSAEKCDEFIAASERRGYEAATVQTEMGPRVVDHIRNNNRVLYKDFNVAQELWTELAPYAPKTIGESEAIGLNELFRFYRYQPGQQFRKHRDQSYIRNSQEASYYTFMIYLNDNFNGGETTFNNLVVTPTERYRPCILSLFRTRRSGGDRRSQVCATHGYYVST